MLTESQNFIEEKYPAVGCEPRRPHLYGKDQRRDAICKSDADDQGNDPPISKSVNLSTDEFSHMRFGWMLSNRPM